MIQLWPTTGVGAQAKCNLDLLHKIASVVSQLGGPWLIGCDWNFTPAELIATGWLMLVGGAAVAPLPAAVSAGLT